jgi:membrane protease YdiL (CAAX protease family)
LYCFGIDVLECAATALVLRVALLQHWPLPPGWFALNIRGAARHWPLLLAAVATYPFLSALTLLAHDALGGSTAHTFWEGASVVALRDGSCDGVALCLYVASHALLAPMWEETVFRGFLLPSLLGVSVE